MAFYTHFCFVSVPLVFTVLIFEILVTSIAFKAWALESEASARVGFRLAFNYLKAKRYVEAINVCHKVMKAFLFGIFFSYFPILLLKGPRHVPRLSEN